MNICITGAFGYIGSRLVRSLDVKKLNKVYLVDNLSVYQNNTPFYLFDLPSTYNFIYKKMDILSEEMRGLIKDSDIVVHLAASTNAEASVSAKAEIKRNNIQGTNYIANLCEEYNASLIFPSTTSVYATKKHIITEHCDASDLGPQSPYGESKLYSERQLQKLVKKNKLSCVIFRFGSMFGYSVGMRLHTAINKFMWQASNGDEIKVWRTALNQNRPYCDIADGVNAINFAINNHIFDGNIYNIVTTNTTVKEILSIIKEYIPKMKITYTDSLIMNDLSYIVSNEKSFKRGFTYKGDLKKSIKECMVKLKNVNFEVKKEL